LEEGAGRGGVVDGEGDGRGGDVHGCLLPDAPGAARRTAYNVALGEDVPVTSDRTSAGVPARTLALLWRDASAVPRKGPARRLEVDDVVGAAVALADADGLGAVTLRRVAERLGVATMTLYTYVPTKAELIDL